MTEHTNVATPRAERTEAFTEYLADPGLNASTLKKFRESGKAGAMAMADDSPPSASPRFGSALHAYMEDRQAFEAKAVTVDKLKPGALPKTFAKAEQDHPGKIILAEGWAEKIVRMAEEIRAHPAAGPLERLTAEREVCVYWDDPDLGVRCKACLDRFRPGVGAVDFKTIGEMTHKGIERNVHTYGYHMQAAWYIRAMRFGLGIEFPSFAFIFVGSDAPHDVVVCDLDERAIVRGWIDCLAAFRRWHEWKTTGSAPGLASSVMTVMLPKWADDEREQPAFPLLPDAGENGGG